MKVHWQEAAMAAAIAWIFAAVSQAGQVGLWAALLGGLPFGLLAGVAYWFLMPWVIRRAQKEAPPARDEDETQP